MDSKTSVILEAAKKRFAHYGISKTTMNEIATDIGMSKASLYYYFPDKEKIFIAVVEQDIAEFVNTIESLISKPSKPSFKLRKYVSYRNELLVRLLNLAKVETLNTPEVFNPVYDDLKANFYNKERQLIQRILQIGIDEQAFIKFPADSYSDLFLSSMIGLRATILAREKPSETTFEKIEHQTRLLADLFLKAIKAEEK